MTKALGTQTLAIHAGEHPDPTTGAASPNLVMSTTFLVDPEVGFSVEDMADDAPFIYSRWNSPTVDQLERKLAVLEQAEASIAFASGMGAISALFTHCLGHGDQMVMSDVTYAGASELANDILPRMGVEVIRVNMTQLDEVRAVINERTKLVYIESPCNPLMRLTDIAAVVEIAHANGVQLAIDSTFASPIATQPVSLGADYVIHSLTKYIGGHGDALGGALVGRKADLQQIRQVAARLGGVLSPFNAWLILRGAATLPLRMKAHEENGLAVANFLESHPKVRQVVYPGLPSHPQHELARRQMRNFSSMLTFRVDDGPHLAKLLAEHLEIWHYAVSLGHHRSLIFYMDTAKLRESSYKLTDAQYEAYRELAGDGMFRVSVGLEDAADLCDDLAQVFARL